AFAVGEILTLAFFAAFLAAGAVGAAIAAALGLPILVQVLVFGIVGVGGILLFRPVVMRSLHRGGKPPLLSGAEAMIGQRAVLTEPILGIERPGHLVIFGERWPAITADGSPLSQDTTVLIKSLRNATLVVEPVQSSSAST
ncbi:MAG TPA: NfeD family protein, partial [bacterium]|nr:NfeD family protein [bacterium]